MSCSFVQEGEAFDLYLAWTAADDRPFTVALPVGETPEGDFINGRPVIRFEFVGHFKE